MPRHCPDCKSQMEDDTLICWCPQAGCTFSGYVVLRTGKIVRDEQSDDTEWQPGIECEHGYDACPICDAQ